MSAETFHGLEMRYDELADALTVLRQWDAVHTARAPAHDSLVILLSDADGRVTGLTLHEPRSMLPADWVIAAAQLRVPNDLYLAVLEWLRKHSLARPFR